MHPIAALQQPCKVDQLGSSMAQGNLNSYLSPLHHTDSHFDTYEERCDVKGACMRTYSVRVHFVKALGHGKRCL